MQVAAIERIEPGCRRRRRPRASAFMPADRFRAAARSPSMRPPGRSCQPNCWHKGVRRQGQRRAAGDRGPGRFEEVRLAAAGPDWDRRGKIDAAGGRLSGKPRPPLPLALLPRRNASRSPSRLRPRLAGRVGRERPSPERDCRLARGKTCIGRKKSDFRSPRCCGSAARHPRRWRPARFWVTASTSRAGWSMSRRRICIPSRSPPARRSCW